MRSLVPTFSLGIGPFGSRNARNDYDFLCHLRPCPSGPNRSGSSTTPWVSSGVPDRLYVESTGGRDFA